MILLVVILVMLFVCSMAGAAYVFGFRLGGENWQRQLLEVRRESARAGREIHDLTRQAFIAMAEEAEKRRQQ